MTPGRTPPRFVPTLTEVVKSSVDTRRAGETELSQDQLIMRVMQRVDIALERKLREAIAETVLEQTRTIAPLLREEIESVVRETVSQAFADELGAKRPR
jgi:hypothetical protein